MNKYRIVIYKEENNKLYFYRYSTKGAYKNQWEHLISARDKNFKELKNNKSWFLDKNHIKEENIKDIKNFAENKEYEFILK